MNCKYHYNNVPNKHGSDPCCELTTTVCKHPCLMNAYLGTIQFTCECSLYTPNPLHHTVHKHTCFGGRGRVIDETYTERLVITTTHSVIILIDIAFVMFRQ